MDAVMTQHIVMTPGVCGGKPRIDGTRIRVMDVVAWHVHRGDSIDRILDNFPQLSPGEVHAALSFYYDNVSLIEAAFTAERRLEAEFRELHPDRVVTLPGE